MACLGRWAEAWQFAAFWCVGRMRRGNHVGALADPDLNDPQTNFIKAGFKANEGMVLYNLTQNTNGLITVVTANTMTAGIAWDNGDLYRAVDIDGSEQATIENYLNITAGNINAALAAVGACDCTKAAWALGELAKINIVEAGAMHQCRCADPKMDSETKRMFLEFAERQTERIRTGELELCDGHTGKDYPAFQWAEQATTPFAAAEIIKNRWLREL